MEGAAKLPSAPLVCFHTGGLWITTPCSRKTAMTSWMRMGVVLGLAMLAWPSLGSADRDRDDDAAECAASKIEAAGRYSRCLSRESAEAVEDGDFESRHCEARLDRRFNRAERRDDCSIEGDADTIGEFLAEVQIVAEPTYPTKSTTTPRQAALSTRT